jgi:hypothetical protein
VTPLRLVEIPYADHRHITRENRRRWPAERGGDSGEHGVAMAEQVRERHPVDVATDGRLGRVRVAMRVEPDDAEPFAALGERNGRTRNGPRGNRVIAPDGQWHRSGDDTVGGHARELHARGRDGREKRTHRTGELGRPVEQHLG